MGAYDRKNVLEMLKRGEIPARPWANADPKKITKVDCTGCHACCHSIVWLTENDNPARYMTNEMITDDGGIIQVLMRRPDGSCIYLGPKGCTIYEHHPEVCRSFHCGELLKILPSEYIEKLEDYGDEEDQKLIESAKRNSLADV